MLTPGRSKRKAAGMELAVVLVFVLFLITVATYVIVR